MRRGKRDVQELIQTTGAEHCWVEHIGPIGCCDDEYLLSALEPIHLGEHLVDNSLGGL